MWYGVLDPWWGYIAMLGSALLGGLGIAPVWAKPDASTGEGFAAFLRRLGWVLLGFAGLSLAMTRVLVGAQSVLWEFFSTVAQSFVAAIVAAAVGSLALRILIVRFLVPWASGLLRRWRINQQVDTPEDIRDEHARYQPRVFDPRPLWPKPGGREGPGVFVGQLEGKNSVYVPWAVFCETHGQVIAPTRFGKGVVLGNALAQAIRARMSSWYFDPKGDSHIPAIMAEAAAAAGVPFYVLDLVNGIGSYAPFAGGSAEQRAARLISAFKLEDTGSEGDYYRRSERDLIRKVCSSVGPAQASIERLLGAFQRVKAEKFANDERRLAQDTSVESGLQEWASLQGIVGLPDRGLNVANALRERAAVYVRCTTSGLARDVARSLIIELTDTALTDEPAKRGEHAFLVTDEARAMISSPLVSALTTVAGAGMTVWLAYQSMLDMRNMDDKRLDAGSVEGAINVNCQVKILYGTNDIETAEWVSKTSGTKRVLLAQMEQTEVGAFGGERWGEKRAYRQDEAQLINANTVLALPPRIAIALLPSNPARLMWVSWVPYSKEPLTTAIDAQRAGELARKPDGQGTGKTPKTVPLPAPAAELPTLKMKNPSA